MIIRLINRKSESIRCAKCGVLHIVDIDTISILKKHNLPYICNPCEWGYVRVDTAKEV